MLHLKSNSSKETMELGRLLGSFLFPGSLVLLFGELGTGKTTFTKGIALGLGIKESVTSPTFTIIHEYYGGKLPLYHIDAYRLQESDELWEIGIEEYLNGSGVTVIEWPHLIEEFTMDDCLKIYLKRDPKKENMRLINIEVKGENNRKIVEELVKNADSGGG